MKVIVGKIVDSQGDTLAWFIETESGTESLRTLLESANFQEGDRVEIIVRKPDEPQ